MAGFRPERTFELTVEASEFFTKADLGFST